MPANLAGSDQCSNLANLAENRNVKLPSEIHQNILSTLEWVRTPLEHALILHCGADAKGQVTVARKEKTWNEERFDQADLPYIIQDYANRRDVYLSQNRFYGRRRVVNLCQLNALHVDLDYYKIEALRNLAPETVYEAALFALEEHRLPEPTYALASGGGLYLVWLHSPVPKQGLTRWNLCQKLLNDALADLGADFRASDAARVLRLVGTLNSKHRDRRVFPIRKLGLAYPFDALFDEIVPVARRDLEWRRFERFQAFVKGHPSDAEDEKPPRRGREENLTLKAPELWRNRLDALRFLIEHVRIWELPSGERDPWMFWAGNATAWLTFPHFLGRELIELARQFVPTWTHKETVSRLYSVLERSQRMARGETTLWNGKPRSYLYRGKDERIIRDIGITDDEQQRIYDHFGFPVLCNQEIKKEYDAKQKREERRARGIKPWEEYLVEHQRLSEERKQQALALKAQGMSIRQIAKKLDIGKSQIQRDLSGVQ